MKSWISSSHSSPSRVRQPVPERSAGGRRPRHSHCLAIVPEPTLGRAVNHARITRCWPRLRPAARHAQPYDFENFSAHHQLRLLRHVESAIFSCHRGRLAMVGARNDTGWLEYVWGKLEALGVPAVRDDDALLIQVNGEAEGLCFRQAWGHPCRRCCGDCS
jgi:hypothetical protein